MSAVPQPVAALGDTLTLTCALMGLRYLLLWFGREWVARWVARITAVVVLLPALRLYSLIAQRPDATGVLILTGTAILAAGAALIAIDQYLAPRIVARSRRGRA